MALIPYAIREEYLKLPLLYDKIDYRSEKITS